MTYTKRIIAIFISIIMVFSLLPSWAYAEMIDDAPETGYVTEENILSDPNVYEDRCLDLDVAKLKNNAENTDFSYALVQDENPFEAPEEFAIPAEEPPAEELETAEPVWEEPAVEEIPFETEENIIIEDSSLQNLSKEDNASIQEAQTESQTAVEAEEPTDKTDDDLLIPIDAEEQTSSQEKMMSTDITPPELQSIDITVTSKTGPSGYLNVFEAKVTITASDNLSGLADAQIDFLYPDGVTLGSSGTEPFINDKLENSYYIDETEDIGEYRLYYIFIRDKAGNTSTYYSDIAIEQEFTNYGTEFTGNRFPGKYASFAFEVYDPEELTSITSITNVETGIELEWKNTGVSQYRIYRKERGDKSFIAIDDISKTHYIDKTVIPGAYYTYKIASLDKNGTEIGASREKHITYLSPIMKQDTDPPVLETININTSYTTRQDGTIKSVEAKVTITASDNLSGLADAQIDFLYPDGATMGGSGTEPFVNDKLENSFYIGETGESGEYRLYSIFIRDKAGNSSAYYSDIAIEQEFTNYGTEFTGNRFPGKYASYSFRFMKPDDVPEIITIANASSSVKITWNATGAAKYRVYRKTENTSWEKISDTSATTYTDQEVSSGTKYSYRVCGINAEGTKCISERSKTKTITRLTAPILRKIGNTKRGVKISWNAVTGANKYRVFRKGSNETKWTSLTNTNELTYFDNTVASGKEYTYAVTAFSDSYYGIKSNTKTIKYVAAPTISSVKNTKTCITVKWAKVTGAKQYQIFRRVKTSSGWGQWKEQSTISGTSYIDTSVKGGKQYQYRLRSLDGNGNVLNAGYSPAKGIKYVSVVKISKLTNVKTGVKINWAKVAGASQYRIWRKVNNGNWKKIADTTAVTYTDKTVKNGKQYSYRIRPMNQNDKFLNTYSAVKSITFTKAPAIESITKTNGKLVLTWTEITGATKYRVFRKGPGDADWVKLGDVKKLTYTDKTAVAGTKYSYAIKAYNGTAKAWSAFSAAKSIQAK